MSYTELPLILLVCWSLFPSTLDYSEIRQNNKAVTRRRTNLHRVEFEPTIPVFKHLRHKTVMLHSYCELLHDTHVSPFKTTIKLNYIQIFSPYRAVNTLRLSYTNQSVNGVQ
jgi:hypothetical protein